MNKKPPYYYYSKNMILILLFLSSVINYFMAAFIFRAEIDKNDFGILLGCGILLLLDLKKILSTCGKVISNKEMLFVFVLNVGTFFVISIFTSGWWMLLYVPQVIIVFILVHVAKNCSHSRILEYMFINEWHLPHVTEKYMNYLLQIIFWLIAIIMCIEFIFILPFTLRPIEENEAIVIKASLEEVVLDPGRFSDMGRGLILKFYDHGDLYVEAECTTRKLVNDLEGLEKGSELTILTYPRAKETVLSISIGDEGILDFEESQKKIQAKTKGFIGLGMFCVFVLGCVIWAKKNGKI